MRVETVQFGELSVLWVRETRLDASNAAAFKAAVAPTLERSTMQLLVDLSDVAFIDSTGLGALVGIQRTLGRQRELVVCGLTPAVKTLFRLTRIDNVLRAFPTRSEAIQAIAQPSVGA